MLARSHHSKVCVIPIKKRPPPFTHIPLTIRPLRPQRSLSGPVTVCRTPQTPGYTEFRIPIRATARPKLEKKGGKIPQLIPKFRLFTRPACDDANKLPFLNEARQKASQNPSSSPDAW